jgi:hypothetical protein
MWVTVNLADDVATAVETRSRKQSISLSEAVNDLIRAGLTPASSMRPFRQQTHDLAEGIDFSNVSDALETLDGPASP